MDIEIALDGKNYTGSYYVAGNLITVHYEDESRQTDVNGAKDNTKSLAETMLRIMVVNKLKSASQLKG